MNIKLIGNFIQHLEVELMPGEDFYAQKGALIYLEQGIEKEVVMNGGGGSGAFGAIGSLIGAKLSGESAFLVHYFNRAQAAKRIVIGGSFGLLPVKIQNETLLCNYGAYVASNNLIKISTRISVTGILGGLGFLQKLTGSSTVFLDCKGQPITKELGYGETIEVDENHIIALQGISEAQVSSAWSLKNVFGGEGLSMLKITGPGKVYLSPGSLIPEES